VFRGGLATTEIQDGAALLRPRPEIAIDRIVELTLPEEGVQTVHLRLSFDCLGETPSFLLPRTSCIDAERRDAPATSGFTLLEEGAEISTQVGTAPLAREVPCPAAAPAGTVCVPGGFSILGDPALWGIADDTYEDSLPLRPVHLSPFLLDETEVTVGRFRALIQGGASFAEMPLLQDPADIQLQYCTFLGEADPGNDALPLNCLSWETAGQICEALGGALPTEAQWEHAARGRGQSRDYPWGDAIPTCCAASLCAGPEPSGSHPLSDACGGLGDVSRDGVLDMAGSVSEYVRDKFRPYGADCWGLGGILADPVCEDDAATAHAARGATWFTATGRTLVALRRVGYERSNSAGLRCAYEAAP
jgi:formylglycine-generating enzyme required for sulfatase activity